MWKQEHQHLTDSDQNHNQRGVPSSVAGRSVPVFEYPRGDTSRSPNDNSIRDPFPVPIINPTSVPSETPIKDPCFLSKEFPSAKSINMLI